MLSAWVATLAGLAQRSLLQRCTPWPASISDAATGVWSIAEIRPLVDGRVRHGTGVKTPKRRSGTAAGDVAPTTDRIAPQTRDSVQFGSAFVEQLSSPHQTFKCGCRQIEEFFSGYCVQVTRPHFSISILARARRFSASASSDRIENPPRASAKRATPRPLSK
jgi:hypothetical protein